LSRYRSSRRASRPWSIPRSTPPSRAAALTGWRSRRSTGQRHVWLQPDRKGDPGLPLSDAELEDKLLELAAPVIGAERARTLLRNIWSLEQAGDLQGLGG
jgi:hypothetical protein